jgi:hypothetical protein
VGAAISRRGPISQSNRTCPPSPRPVLRERVRLRVHAARLRRNKSLASTCDRPGQSPDIARGTGAGRLVSYTGDVRDICAALFFLATLSPGVLLLLVIATVGLDAPMREGDWCALGWGVIVVGLVARGVLLGISEGVREDRKRNGQCLSCGYDLRTTPDRCPECGAAPENAGPLQTEPLPKWPHGGVEGTMAS